MKEESIFVERMHRAVTCAYACLMPRNVLGSERSNLWHAGEPDEEPNNQVILHAQLQLDAWKSNVCPCTGSILPPT